MGGGLAAHPVKYYGNPYMTKDMKRMVLKLILLRRIRKGRAYSYEIVKEFDNPKISEFLMKGGTSVKNDIYNTVKALEKSGYIRMNAIIEDGRLKKYYRITAQGRSAVKESKALFLKSMKELTNIIR